MTTKGMKIGILTAGGDCPGINAAIRGVAKTAIISHNMKVYGISSGFMGLIELAYTKWLNRMCQAFLRSGVPF